MTEDTGATLRLDEPVTQQRFAELVAIGQPAVSALIARGVLNPAAPVGAWLQAYASHLREVAAGRDPDGLLSAERTRLAREQADRIALQNAIARRDYMPVQLLEEVLAMVSRQAAQQLDALLPEVLQRFPYLAGEPARFIGARLAAAREAMASARFDPEGLEADIGDDEEAAG